MEKGDKVKIVSDVYGEAGKTGFVNNVHEIEGYETLYEVNTGNPTIRTYTATEIMPASIVEVKEIVSSCNRNFIEEKPVIVSKDDAYKRKTITDEIIELWHTEINGTDTRGLSIEHNKKYDKAFEALKAVVDQELRVICSDEI